MSGRVGDDETLRPGDWTMTGQAPAGSARSSSSTTCPRWEGKEDVPAGWLAKVTSEDLARNNG